MQNLWLIARSVQLKHLRQSFILRSPDSTMIWKIQILKRREFSNCAHFRLLLLQRIFYKWLLPFYSSSFVISLYQQKYRSEIIQNVFASVVFSTLYREEFSLPTCFKITMWNKWYRIPRREEKGRKKNSEHSVCSGCVFTEDVLRFSAAFITKCYARRSEQTFEMSTCNATSVTVCKY